MKTSGTPFIRVLGCADARPTRGYDHSCYTVNDELLIDACPSAEMQLLGAGIDPVGIRDILISHFHADHYMGLPALLFYRSFFMKHDLSDLTVYGPAETVRESVSHCLWIVSEGNISRLKPPRIVPLSGGEELSVGHYKVLTESADHTVPGLCYRIEDEMTHHTVGFTGDTAYQEKFVRFFADVGLLVHEASFGAKIFNENVCRHADAEEAAALCESTHAKRLLLTHMYEPRREEALRTAKEKLGDVVRLALPGTCVEF